jgi:hypothetical protein
MNGADLPFTLDLGRNWEMWQALRELESNCRDEKGYSARVHAAAPLEDNTTIVITGSTAEDTYSKLSDIFISSQPLFENNDLSIHPLENPEQGRWLYYRGVRAMALKEPALFRYNVRTTQDLTEDRTFKAQWSADWDIHRAIAVCDNQQVLQKILLAGEHTYENGIEWRSFLCEKNPVFLSTVENLGVRVLPKAWKAYREARGFEFFESVEMDTRQQIMLQKAIAFISKMGEPRIASQKICMANDLGKANLGLWYPETRTIYIAQRTFEMGMKQLISCLYEEYIHADRGYADCNYEMQSFLFDTIIGLASRLQGEPI